MQIIKVQIAYDTTFEASNLSPAELAQLMILITKCQVYRTTLEKVGTDYVHAAFTKDIELNLSRANVEVHPSYEAAVAHLKALKAAADAAALVMSEPEKV